MISFIRPLFFLVNSNEDNNSTWTEIAIGDFDIISEVVFKAKYRVKSRVKTVSGYIPQIVIE